MHEPVGITIREGKRSVPKEIFSPNGHRYTATSKEIFIVVHTFDFENDTRELYEFDLMKIMVDKNARKQLKDLIIKTKAESNEFGYRNNN